jgi:hypothetical protein
VIKVIVQGIAPIKLALHVKISSIRLFANSHYKTSALFLDDCLAINMGETPIVIVKAKYRLFLFYWSPKNKYEV